MAQSAANLVDHVLPEVPLRQYVVTFPFELRARLAYDGKLLSSLTRIAMDSILSFYKRRIRDEQNIKGQSGAVSVVQRVSSDLRLNPHLHAIVVDGVFSANNDSVVFHPLVRLDDSDVADLLQVIRVRLVNLFVRRGIVESRDEPTLLDNADDADPSLAQLADAAVSGAIPAGPARACSGRRASCGHWWYRRHQLTNRHRKTSARTRRVPRLTAPSIAPGLNS
jgi:hypothetical protein